MTGTLRQGFVSPPLRLAVLPSAQLFRRRSRGPVRIGRALATMADLRAGDYVVHEDHGIGRFVRFDTKEVGGVVRDYLYLEFRGDDRLYVPHEQLAKVSRYVGADGRAPALCKLGGKAWQTLKCRARVAVRELAGELLALYARRQTATKQPLPARRRVDGPAGGELPVRGDRRPADRDRRGQGGPGVGASDGPAGLRRRRLRQDRGRGAGGVQGGRTPAARC